MCNILKNYYAINRHGEIIRIADKRKLKCKLDKDGYLCLSLCVNDLIEKSEHKRKMFRVAGLVLREFKGSPPLSMIDPTVEHLDGNKTNNHISNLCWLERDKNSSNRKHTSPGEKNGSAKLTENDVAQIKWLLINTNLSLKQIGEKYDVSKSTINNIKRNENWTHIQPAQVENKG